MGCDPRGRVTFEQSGLEHMLRPAPRLAQPDRSHDWRMPAHPIPAQFDTDCRRIDRPPSCRPKIWPIFGLEPRSSAPAGKLPVVAMAAHEDEAVEVVEGAKVDGAAVAGQIVAWIDRRSALRRLRREHLPARSAGPGG